MKKKFLFVLSCFIMTMIHGQNTATNAAKQYTASGGLLGALNLSEFRVSGNGLNHSNANYDTKAGWAFGGWVNFPVSNGFSIEPQLMYSSHRYFTSSTQNVLINDGKIGYISIPVLLKLHLGDHFAVVVGPQLDLVTSLSNNAGSSAQKSDFNNASFSGFAGLEILPHGRVSIFGRYVFGFTNMDDAGDGAKYKNQNVQLGLKLRLFGKKKTEPAYQATSTPLPLDTDGDGIFDDQDKCPTVPGLAKYDGCPIPDRDNDGVNDEMDKCPDVAGLAKYDGCPIPDSDNDGINDELDKCPDVAGLAKYDGCPVPDRDGDGVNDEEDKCPDVPGTVANNGCPEVPEVSDKLSRSVSMDAQRIQFSGSGTKFTTGSNTSLNDIVKILNENPDLKVKVEGHTDNAGDDDANMTLSTNRADAVKAYLINKGISEDRITTEGFGETMPIADNNTAAGRMKNRRVEIKVTY